MIELGHGGDGRIGIKIRIRIRNSYFGICLSKNESELNSETTTDASATDISAGIWHSFPSLTRRVACCLLGINVQRGEHFERQHEVDVDLSNSQCWMQVVGAQAWIDCIDTTVAD